MHAAAGAELRLLRHRGFPIPSSFGEASTPVAAMTDPSPGAALVPEPTIQGESSGPRPRWVRLKP